MVLKSIFVRCHNMNNRLSIYNDVIYTYLEHSDKVKFRKIAFKNKKRIKIKNFYFNSCLSAITKK